MNSPSLLWVRVHDTMALDLVRCSDDDYAGGELAVRDMHFSPTNK